MAESTLGQRAKPFLALGFGLAAFGLVTYLRGPDLLARLPFGRHLPVAGARVTSRFGPRRDPCTGKAANHSGLDLGGVPIGTPVRSPISGTVVALSRVGVGNGSINGNAVHIRDANGNRWSFLHLSAIDVAVGERVSPGTRLGAVGQTGRATGPHLHLQVETPAGVRVDPEQFFPRGAFA